MARYLYEDNNNNENTSLGNFEYLRLSATNLTRVNNVDVIVTEDGEELGFCHIPVFNGISYSDPIRAVFGVFLAMKHLNDGYGGVIPELDGLNSRCNIRFTTEVFDTEGSVSSISKHEKERTAIKQLINLTRRRMVSPHSPEEKNCPSGGGTEQLPCAILGAERSAVSSPMAIINSIEGFPQISHYSTASQLDDKSQYNLFGRVIPSDNGTALIVIFFLKDKLNVSHFGVIHTDDSYGMGYSVSLQTAITNHAPHIQMHSVKIPYHNPSLNDIKTAIKSLKSTQFRYFFAIINPDYYSIVMTEAYLQGIAGPGYNWIFSDSLWPELFTEKIFESNSPLAIATDGISILSAQGGLPGMPIYDKFVQAFHGLNNEADLKYLESKLPHSIDMPLEELFTNIDSLTGASFLYDATIALGMGACNAKKNNTYFQGQDHYHNVIHNPFMGSSGNITFDTSTGSRDPTSAYFMFTNIQNKKTESKNDTNAKFSAVPVELFKGGKWVSLSPYVFSDGSKIPPSELPELTVDYNFIGISLRVGGLLFCAVILLTSIAFAGWTYYHREGKIVRASQPLFLLIICFGTLMMGSAIIPLSIDDEVASPEMCSVACMIMPWLFSTGFCMAFSALFSKLWKLNKLFFAAGMVRVQVQNKDVILPMIILSSANMIVLTAWTIISPRKWNRTISGVDVYGRTVSSLGSCDSQKFIPFIVTLIAINMGALCVTLHEAYKARHIKAVLGETMYVAMATASIFLVLLMGIPIIIVASTNQKALYFVNTFIIFIVCMSLLLFIFWPKFLFQRKLELGQINMRHVVRDFSEQSHSYSINRRKRASSNVNIDDQDEPKVGRLRNGSDTSCSKCHGYEQENESSKSRVVFKESEINHSKYPMVDDCHKKFNDESGEETKREILPQDEPEAGRLRNGSDTSSSKCHGYEQENESSKSRVVFKESEINHSKYPMVDDCHKKFNDESSEETKREIMPQDEPEVDRLRKGSDTDIGEEVNELKINFYDHGDGISTQNEPNSGSNYK